MNGRTQCTGACWVVVAALGGCGATRHTDAPPVSGQIVAIGTREGLDAQRLEQGRELYGANCQRCHDLVLPEQRTRGEWDTILPRMFRRARLNPDQQSAVRQYILAAREARAGT